MEKLFLVKYTVTKSYYMSDRSSKEKKLLLLTAEDERAIKIAVHIIERTAYYESGGSVSYGSSKPLVDFGFEEDSKQISFDTIEPVQSVADIVARYNDENDKNLKL